MSKAEQPELDELKKLLRRLETSETSKSEPGKTAEPAEKADLPKAGVSAKSISANNDTKKPISSAGSAQPKSTAGSADKPGVPKKAVEQSATPLPSKTGEIPKSKTATSASGRKPSIAPRDKLTPAPTGAPSSKTVSATATTQPSARPETTRKPDPLLSLSVAGGPREKSASSPARQLPDDRLKLTPENDVHPSAPGLPAVIDPTQTRVTEHANNEPETTNSVRIVVVSAITAAVVSSLAAAAISIVVLRPDLLQYAKPPGNLETADVSPTLSQGNVIAADDEKRAPAEAEDAGAVAALKPSTKSATLDTTPATQPIGMANADRTEAGAPVESTSAQGTQGVVIEQVETVVNPLPAAPTNVPGVQASGTAAVTDPTGAKVIWPASEPDKAAGVPTVSALNDEPGATTDASEPSSVDPIATEAPPSVETTVASLDDGSSSGNTTTSPTARTDAAPTELTIRSSEPVQPSLAGPSRFFVAPGVAVPLPIRVNPSPEALPGHSLIFVGTTRKIELSAGTKLMFDTWQVQVTDLETLKLTVPRGFAREIPLQIELRRPDGLVLDTQNLSVTTGGNAAALGLNQAAFDDVSRMTGAPAQRLIQRAERLIDNGDPLSARVLLELAGNAGSALGFWMLATTYDPQHADDLFVPSGASNPGEAARYYQRANQLGLSRTRFRAP
ncbi:MAG: hypothetical protein AAFR75_02460 [Pseudomonadota bacterium]